MPLTAEQARDRAMRIAAYENMQYTVSEAEAIEKEKNRILEAIQYAANETKLSTIILVPYGHADNFDYKAVKKQLKELGYKVSYRKPWKSLGYSHDEYWTVKW